MKISSYKDLAKIKNIIILLTYLFVSSFF